MQKIHFPSEDGLLITADLYLAHKTKGYILLCHRSHFNRGEYKETAIKLQQLGFICMAIDQRSGMNVLGYINETSTLARKKGLPTSYLDAQQDIEASLDYLYKFNHKKPIIVVGSSYSGCIALLISCDNDKVKAVAAFSPGEYLKGINLAETIKQLTKLTYITSAKKEVREVANVVRHMNPKYITHFKPTVEGFHGSKVLWQSSPGNESYWNSFQKFLLNL